MDKPIKHISARRGRTNMNVGELKYQGSILSQPTLTKDRFMKLLAKSAQPLKPDSKEK